VIKNLNVKTKQLKICNNNTASTWKYKELNCPTKSLKIWRDLVGNLTIGNFVVGKSQTIREAKS